MICNQLHDTLIIRHRHERVDGIGSLHLTQRVSEVSLGVARRAQSIDNLALIAFKSFQSASTKPVGQFGFSDFLRNFQIIIQFDYAFCRGREHHSLVRQEHFTVTIFKEAQADACAPCVVAAQAKFCGVTPVFSASSQRKIANALKIT